MLQTKQRLTKEEIKLRKILATIGMASAVTLAGFSSAFAAQITQPEAVIELFTSQGCHSCPPADKLMGKIGDEGRVLTLSWHVDYWDYLGWKDVFASAENTKRQYGYARTLRERQVYTPQAIVNGRAHAVGSSERKVRSLIQSMTGAKQGLTVPISIEKSDGEVSIKIRDEDMSGTAMLNLVFFNKVHEVEIARGENAGKTLKYHNVVHRAQPVGLVKSDGFEMSYPISEIHKTGYDGCALLLQANDKDGNPGAILGAVVISDM